MGLLEEAEPDAIGYLIERFVLMDDLLIGDVTGEGLLGPFAVFGAVANDTVDGVIGRAFEVGRAVWFWLFRQGEEGQTPQEGYRLCSQRTISMFYEGVCSEVIRMPADAVDGIGDDDLGLHAADVGGDGFLKRQGVHIGQPPIGEVQYGQLREVQRSGYRLHLVEPSSPHLLPRIVQFVTLCRGFTAREREQIYLMSFPSLTSDGGGRTEGLVVGMRKDVEDARHGG